MLMREAQRDARTPWVPHLVCDAGDGCAVRGDQRHGVGSVHDYKCHPGRTKAGSLMQTVSIEHIALCYLTDGISDVLIISHSTQL